jgi:hypothetical protein
VDIRLVVLGIMGAVSMVGLVLMISDVSARLIGEPASVLDRFGLAGRRWLYVAAVTGALVALAPIVLA